MEYQGPRVSVVIPVRNRPEVIHRAIDSILAQTYPIEEIIVVDDGSTDGTVDSVRRRIRAGEPIKLLTQSGSGAPIARNAGAAVAKGDLIAFLDSDDAWAPEKIERQVALLEQFPEAPAVFTDNLYTFKRRPPRRSSNPALVAKMDLLFRNELGGTSSALIRRDAFHSAGGFRPDLPACQDWEFWIRLADIGDMAVVQDPLVIYFFDGGARISKNITNVRRGHEMVYASIYGMIDDPNLLRRVRAEHMKRYAEIYSRNAFAPARAVAYAVSAAWKDPKLRRFLEIPRVVTRLVTYPLT